jgi:glycerophosphoryl diester phosphodiesterase
MARFFPVLIFLLITPAAQAAVPAVQSHRGGPVLDGVPTFAEETMPAFRNAAQNLQSVLELDAKLTKDSVPVVFHDDTLDRTTNCTGLVADKTLAELASCKADILGAPGNDLETASALEPVPIPTLAEVLAFAKADGIGVNLEIKNYFTDDDWDNGTGTFANRVMDVVLQSKIPARQVIIQSFTPDNLDIAARRMPDAEIAVLALACCPDVAVNTADTRGWEWASPAWPVSKAYVDDAHARGVRVVPYTINQRDDVLAAAEAGVDALITDDPLMALKTLDTKAPRVTFKVLRAKLAAVRRTGKLPVRVTTNEASTVALNARLAGKALGSRELRFREAGSRKVTFRLKRSVRRALRDRKRAKAVVAGKWRDLALNDGSGRAVTTLR